jgi:hypothetical protein
MAAYSQFLGFKVTVRYRVGEMVLSATGTFAADSGRSIFLEQHLEQRGTRKYFRWEIPYPYIQHIETAASAAPEDDSKLATPHPDSMQKSATANAGESAGGAPSVLPFPQRPKTA